MYKYFTIAAVILNIFFITQAAGKDTFKSISIALGTSNSNEKDFRLLELRGNISLPFFKYVVEGKFKILPLADISVGSLMQGDEFDLLTTLTSGIAILTFSNRVNMDAGGGFAILSDDVVGQYNFGGYIQFALHAGIHFRLTDNLYLGYRFFHISDAGIFDGNGLNRHLLELGYAFSY